MHGVCCSTAVLEYQCCEEAQIIMGMKVVRKYQDLQQFLEDRKRN